MVIMGYRHRGEAAEGKMGATPIPGAARGNVVGTRRCAVPRQSSLQIGTEEPKMGAIAASKTRRLYRFQSSEVRSDRRRILRGMPSPRFRPTSDTSRIRPAAVQWPASKSHCFQGEAALARRKSVVEGNLVGLHCLTKIGQPVGTVYSHGAVCIQIDPRTADRNANYAAFLKNVARGMTE